MASPFNYSEDRKRRFLRGLNALLGNNYDLENKEISISEAVSVPIPEFRKRLADFYGLEFTNTELERIRNTGITTEEFTEKYCPIIYEREADLNTLVSSSMKNGAIELKEMDKAHKYGLNGREWCDVTEGPCSCGASHH